MAINFPNSPAVNDTFTVGGINFTFTGVKWESGAVVELSSDTTPTLGGHLDGGAKNINNVGVITATGFSGPLTGNVTGNADTATTATVATDAEGLTGNPSIQVTNATVLGNLDVQGTTSTIDTAITQVDSLAVEGNVGIGTTNALAKLHVNLATDRNVVFNIDANGQSRISSFNDVANASQILGLNGSELNFQTGNTERVRIESDGKLFIDRTHASATTGNHPALDIETYPNGTAGATFATGIDFRIAGVHKKRLAITNADSNVGTGDWVFYQDNGVNEGLRITSAGNGEFGGTVSDSKGDVRDIPQSSNSSARTLVATDGGKVVMTTSGGWVIPASVMSQGNTVTLLNGDGATQTINATALNAFYNTSDGANIKANTITLGGASMATIWFSSGTVAYISATNMTVS